MSHSQRRTFVNLSVFAGSAAMFGAAWLGVVRADQAEADTAAVLASVPITTSGAAAPQVAAAGTGAVQSQASVTTIPAPAPRQVVVVRQSRAS